MTTAIPGAPAAGLNQQAGQDDGWDDTEPVGEDETELVEGEEVGTFDQLTLTGLGAKPTGSVINLPALRVELGNRQFKDGEVLRITADIEVNKLSFFNEKRGKTAARRVRAHSATWNKDSVDLS